MNSAKSHKAGKVCHTSHLFVTYYSLDVFNKKKKPNKQIIHTQAS